MKPAGPNKVSGRATAEADAKQAVEPHEMVHVGMRHEDVTRPQDLARGECGDVAQVEQESAALEQHVHEQGRVGETAR